jgi:hypothetical protein
VNNLRKNLSNAIGWRTSRKIIVIESDDWGSIRTRSKKDYETMLSRGLEVDRSNFTKYDCLESNIDLENLFDLLSKHKDSSGRPAVLTPMCIMANPDFERIKKSGFQIYYYQSFVDTYKKYPNHDKVYNLWQLGIKERFFVPAFHGREHLNVSRWLKALQDGHEGLMTAFELQSIGAIRYKGVPIPEYLGAFHPDYSSDIHSLEKVIESGAELFKTNLGYQPTHFITPNRESPKALDKTLNNIGVKYLTMSKLRKYPLGDEKYKIEYNWIGRQNENGQIIVTRNCGFEPSEPSHIDWVDVCLKEINIAFKWHKPAIISSHRVNYVSSIDSGNAIHGLKELDRLLSDIIGKWPDVEFMTSTELGYLIALSG